VSNGEVEWGVSFAVPNFSFCALFEEELCDASVAFFGGDVKWGTTIGLEGVRGALKFGVGICSLF